MSLITSEYTLLLLEANSTQTTIFAALRSATSRQVFFIHDFPWRLCALAVQTNSPASALDHRLRRLFSPRVERLPGFRDFYPEPLPDGEAWSANVRERIFRKWCNVARKYAFQPYDGPPLELLDLYTAKSGQEIVGQLYNFEDKGERAVSLRPEITPTVARMVAARERHYKKPIKWYSIR